MFHVDWGNVPAWLGAGSLLLAFTIFIRDRRNSDRLQVDRVGVWFTETYERRMPGVGEDQGRVEEADIQVHVRNASYQRRSIVFQTRCLCGYPHLFRLVRHLGLVCPGCPCRFGTLRRLFIGVAPSVAPSRTLGEDPNGFQEHPDSWCAAAATWTVGMSALSPSKIIPRISRDGRAGCCGITSR
jgi:hypothetical protein